MSAQTGTGVVRHEAKGFCGRGLDDLVDVEPHAVADHFQFIDQTDIDRTVDVFQQFGHFCHPCGTDWDNFINDVTVKGSSHFETGFGAAADHLGDSSGAVFVVSRVFAFRRIDQESILAYDQAGGFNTWFQLFFGGAWVSGALKHDHLPFSQVGQ